MEVDSIIKHVKHSIHLAYNNKSKLSDNMETAIARIKNFYKKIINPFQNKKFYAQSSCSCLNVSIFVHAQ